jgi:hypothetical protein
MSKELEALKRVESVIEMADDSCDLNTAVGRNLEEAILRINDDMKLIKQALRTPTADEVCEVLSGYFNCSNIFYDNNHGFYYKEGDGYGGFNKHFIVLKSIQGKRYYIEVALPPHLINLISRFYMGVDLDV